MFNKREYEYVLEVAREGSFSKAAKKLYISQPALSGAVKKIEGSLHGVELFDRSVTPVTLTEAGQYYLDQMGRMYAMNSEMERHFSDLAGIRTGHVNIGSSAYFCAYFIPRIVKSFGKLYPECQVNVTETDTDGMDAGLKNGQFDITIDVERMDPEAFNSVTLGNEYMVMAVPASFEINKKMELFQISRQEVLEKDFLRDNILPVDLQKFSKEPFLCLKKNSDSYTRCTEICAHAGFVPKIVMYFDQLQTAFNVARSSQLGIVFFRDGLLRYSENTRDLCYYKIGDALSKRDIFLTMKKNPAPEPVVEEFIKYIMMVWDKR